MGFRFEKLEVWQQSRGFINLIYKATSSFPKSELFALTDQLRRAAVSIALNIAEGSDRKSDKEFTRFLRMSVGSLEEVVTALYVALDQNYISKENFDILYSEANNLFARLNALVNSIKNNKQ